MSPHRFFTTGPLEDACLSAADLHHLRDVLRLIPGEEIVLADGAGRQALARIASVSVDGAAFELVRDLPVAFIPNVTLLQGLSRGPKMDLLVQKATEVGVTRIVPVVCARSFVRLSDAAASGRASRWRRIAAEAAKQSQRSVVPRVDDPVSLTEAPDLLAEFDHVLVPWEDASGEGIGEALGRLGAGSSGAVGVVVGPEGGLEDAEVTRLTELGAVSVTLGGTVLRTETAGIVAVALVSYELGGLGGARRD